MTSTETAETASPPPRTNARRRGRAFLLSGVSVVVIVAALLAALRWTGFVESLGFIHPGVESFQTPRGFEDVEFAAADATKLHGWFMPAVRAPGSGLPACVLHVHGNQGSVNVHASWSQFLTAHGISVFVFDYRSFGRSQDSGTYLTREHLMADTRAALDVLLTRKDIDTQRIGVYGMSLGGAFALGLAAERPEVRSVATLGTFSSWPSVASDRVPVLADILIRTGLSQADNAAKLGNRPLLVIHGDRDRIVLSRHADIIADAAMQAGVPVEKHIVPGARHLNIMDDAFDTADVMAAFFKRTLGVDQAGKGASTR